MGNSASCGDERYGGCAVKLQITARRNKKGRALWKAGEARQSQGLCDGRGDPNVRGQEEAPVQNTPLVLPAWKLKNRTSLRIAIP